MRRRLIGLIVVLIVAWGGVALAYYYGLTPRLGLDLQGGTSVVLTAPAGTPTDVVDVAIGIMNDRIEAAGVQEPEITKQGNSTVLVQLPGVEDEERALRALGQTGFLSFRPVIGITAGSVGPSATTTTTASPSSTTSGTGSTSTSAAPTSSITTAASSTTATTTPGSTTTTTLPPNTDPETGLTNPDDPTNEAYLLYEPAEGTPEVLHVGPADLVGSDVADAIPVFDTTQGQWVVRLELTSEGTDKFAAMTAEAASYPIGDPRRNIAIVLDGDVITAPSVATDVDPSTGITGGTAIITFGSSADAEQEAQDTAVILRYGSLPVSFEVSAVQKVSASLGSDSLRLGIISGLVGLLLVATLLMVVYRSLGALAVVGLSVFGALLLLVFGLLGATQGLTLTLAGVTGVIISVGITADSYIVYFERIKEEMGEGLTMRAAVDDGYRAAFRTIITADIVSLLAAILLYWLAVGPVKGFALSLGIATVLDLVIFRVYTRRAAWLLARTGVGEHGPVSIEALRG